MANLLITGGCGFIGSNLAVYLQSVGHDVTCFDNLSRRGSEQVLARVRGAGIEFVHGDIRNPEDFSKIKGAFDVLIECSAEPSVLVGTSGDDARYMLNNNLVGALNCLEWARVQQADVLFFSTSRVYPYDRLNDLPLEEQDSRWDLDQAGAGYSSEGISESFDLFGARSLYGATKLSAEYLVQEYCFQYGLGGLVNRFGVVAGPWQLGKVDQGVFAYWLANHYFKKPLKYIGYGGEGKQVRDVLHIHDLCRLVEIQIGVIKDYQGQVFNAGGGRTSNLSLRETTAICQALTGNEVEISADLENRPADLPWYLTDSRRAIETFGWKPEKTGEDVLSDFYEWLVDHEVQFAAIFNA